MNISKNAPPMDCLFRYGEKILYTKNAREKTRMSRKFAANWHSISKNFQPTSAPKGRPPLHPERPEKPDLVNPRDVPKRRKGSLVGRISMLHAVAHIELNAVDLHWDMLVRFGHLNWPSGFYDDWIKAADDEAKHFNLIADCLENLGSFYGALPAHAGMWQAAEDTATDIMGRLAVVPMVLEARGLDVTPAMIEIFQNAGHDNVVKALSIIYKDEVTHVAYGAKWFHFLCGRKNIDPKVKFHHLVRKYFRSKLRPPFNEEKRAEAGIAPDFYWPLAEEIDPPASMA